MKSTYRNTLILFLLIILSGCATKKDYLSAISANSISVYENYKDKHPKSKYVPEIDEKLDVLYDQRDWRSANSSNTIYSYNQYLRKHPSGSYVNETQEKIKYLEELKRETEHWQIAKKDNSIRSFEFFLEQYPKSRYTYEAKRNISNLKDKNAYYVAFDQNTIDSYKTYLRQYPYGKYSSDAKEKIKKIEEDLYILPIWKKTLKLNTYNGYKKFYYNYSHSSYASLAIDKMGDLDLKGWNNAKKWNSIKSYMNYISWYSDGDYIDEANKKIIDLEVDNIFKGDYGQLPSMNKTSYGYANHTANEIDIYNNTSYTLTVRYSGVESKKVVLKSKRRSTISLKNGNYRIAASVNASGVRNYAGNENLTGANYSIEYYITTSRY
jgi:hypothetical protein